MNRIEKYMNNCLKLDGNKSFAKTDNIGAKYEINKYYPEFLEDINSITVVDLKNFDIIPHKPLKKHNDAFLKRKIMVPLNGDLALIFKANSLPSNIDSKKYQKKKRDNLIIIHSANFKIIRIASISLDMLFDGNYRKEIIFRTKKIIKSLISFWKKYEVE